MTAPVLAAALVLLCLGGLGAGDASASGKISVGWSYGEVVATDEGEYTVSPASAWGLEFARREPLVPEGLQLDCEGFLSLGTSPAQKAGVTLGLDWRPEEGPFAGRQHKVSGSLTQRWPAESGTLPEQAWEANASLQETGLGAATLEAGGRAGAHLHRLSGRDYREVAGYLATRVVLDGEPAGFAWLDPEWVRGFTSVWTPPPEPGAEEEETLPIWYEALALSELPALPPPAAADPASPGEPRPPRLVVSARHTQSRRTYAGADDFDWEAGETSLEVRERRRWGEVAGTYVHTLKHYPADPARTYELNEGEAEVSRHLGPGQGRAAISFRNRDPWPGGDDRYRQLGLRLSYSLPGGAVDWRWAGEGRYRRYLDQPAEDYTQATLEGEVSWPAVTRRGGPSVAAAAALTRERYPNAARPDEYRWRLRLRGEWPVGPAQSLAASLGWAREAALPLGGASTGGSTETLFRLAWRRSF
ncbi:MAG TPA: hypothetical protein GXX28_06185 [Firmicutes bacterium]|nr:hypothetical protein [Bacillota bacterium]